MKNELNEEILKGDVVWMFKGCSALCECAALGCFFVVEEIAKMEIACSGANLGTQYGATGLGQEGYNGTQAVIPINWLRKVPPEKDLEDKLIVRKVYQ